MPPGARTRHLRFTRARHESAGLPVERQIAAFTSADPDDRAAFDARWARMQARAAADNAASIRVLTHCGFVACGTDRGFASARRAEIDEVLLRLDR